MPNNFDLDNIEVVAHLSSITANHMEFLSHWAKNMPNASVAGVNILDVTLYDVIQVLNNVYLKSYIESQEKGEANA